MFGNEEAPGRHVVDSDKVHGFLAHHAFRKQQPGGGRRNVEDGGFVAADCDDVMSQFSMEHLLDGEAMDDLEDP